MSIRETMNAVAIDMLQAADTPLLTRVVEQLDDAALCALVTALGLPRIELSPAPMPVVAPAPAEARKAQGGDTMQCRFVFPDGSRCANRSKGPRFHYLCAVHAA